jgi:hypothetical protein
MEEATEQSAVRLFLHVAQSKMTNTISFFIWAFSIKT